MKIMAIIQLEIKTCKECPHFEEKRMYNLVNNN